MTKENHRSVRHHLSRLHVLFDEPSDAAPAHERIVNVTHICRSLGEQLDDNHCREQLDLIELYAGDLFSERNETSQRGPLSGVEALTHKITKCLSTIEARLFALAKAEAV